MNDPACEKPRRGVLADPCLSGHLRERAVDDRGEYCRAGGDDDLLEVDRLAGSSASIRRPATVPCTWT